MPLRALGYARLSDPGDPNAPTLDEQESMIREYCAAHGYDCIGVLREAHGGEVLRERAKIREALELIEQRGFDVFVPREFDRFCRNGPHYWVFRDILQQKGARIEFVLQAYEDTPEGRLMLNVEAFRAEMEREKIRWRTTRGKLARVKSGKPLHGSKPLYGYRWADAEKSRYVVHAPEANVMERLYAEFTRGATLRGLSQLLADLGVPSPSGNEHWHASQIGRLLAHPAYKGEHAAYRRIERPSANGKRPTMVLRPVDQHIPLEGWAPAIVDAATWEAAQRTLRQNVSTRHSRDGKIDDALLRGGFASCGHCGGRCTVEYYDGRPYYRCGANRHGARRCDTPAIVAVSTTDDPLRSQLLHIAEEYVKARKREYRRQQSGREATAWKDRTRERADQLRKQRNLTAALAEEDTAAGRAAIRSELRAVTDRLTRLEEQETAEREQSARAIQERSTQNEAADLSVLATHEHAPYRTLLRAFNLRVLIWRRPLSPRFELIET